MLNPHLSGKIITEIYIFYLILFVLTMAILNYIIKSDEIILIIN